MKEMISLAKKFKLKVTIPKQNNFKTIQEFENAKDKFFKFMVPYLPGYVSKLKITSTGTISEKINNLPLMVKIQNN